LILEFSEFGADIDFGAALVITAQDIFRSVTGVAYKSTPSGDVLQDMLSVLDNENP
jgi:hypothetical protein